MLLLFRSTMLPGCPAHSPDRLTEGLASGSIIRKGFYQRTSDHARIQRYFCRTCHSHFSAATFTPCYRQHKRQINSNVFTLSVSHVSQRRCAQILRVNRKTIARKLIFLGTYLRERNELLLDEVQRSEGQFSRLQFDEMETAEHTKCKPLSIPLIVNQDRLILGFEVARMPAKGRLAAISLKRYGPLPDERAAQIERLLLRVRPRIAAEAEILSDQCPRYPAVIREVFPQVTHRTEKGRGARPYGQGELKKGGFDPLFALNHTAAMIRANINRMIRKTWCTTKKMDRLKDHLTLYMASHNLRLRGVEISLNS